MMWNVVPFLSVSTAKLVANLWSPTLSQKYFYNTCVVVIVWDHHLVNIAWLNAAFKPTILHILHTLHIYTDRQSHVTGPSTITQLATCSTLSEWQAASVRAMIGYDFVAIEYHSNFPSVLWHCWLGERKGIRPIKKLGVRLLVVTFWLELCMTYSSSCHHHLHHP